jgi:hypothetical protein
VTPTPRSRGFSFPAKNRLAFSGQTKTSWHFSQQKCLPVFEKKWITLRTTTLFQPR